MRALFIVALCVVSAAIGAAADHYRDRLPSAGNYLNKLPSNSADAKHSTAPSGLGGVEVLGDRVKCDVRYQELKLPESEYRAFFDKCMGNAKSTSKSE